MQIEFFRNRSVVVTGAEGFIGSHLVDALLDSGAQVHAVIHPVPNVGPVNLEHVFDRIRIHRVDLTDKHSVDGLMHHLKDSTESPVIFHLAAQAHVGESWERPYQTIASNVVGTLNVLQSIVDHDFAVHRLVVAGTSEEYGNVSEDLRWTRRFSGDAAPLLNEMSSVDPQSIYATSKVASSFLALNYHRAYGLPVVVSRMFNNYGPRQNPRYVTGEIITQALERDWVELGSVEPIRDFCFCVDGVRALKAIGANGKSGEIYVYGQGSSISIGDWADLIIRIGMDLNVWSKRSIRFSESRLRPGATEVECLQVDSAKLHRETGWHPEYTWDEGLRRTITWYSKHRYLWFSQVSWRSNG